MNLNLRPATPEDAQICGRICYEAFKAIGEQHNFPSAWPSPQGAADRLSGLLCGHGFYGVVAKNNGQVVGSCFLDERPTIVGLGPITVVPVAQKSTIGRQLMQHALDRVTRQHRPGVRLVQATYNNASLCLYAKLGFEAREMLSNMQGRPPAVQLPEHAVRQASESDLETCNQLCRQVHGYDRSAELLDAIRQNTATVVEHEDRITGYATQVEYLGHAVGETNEDLKALISAAPAFAGPGFLLPTRNGELFRWCLEHELRVVQPLTLMSIGFYNEPGGVFLPSIIC